MTAKLTPTTSLPTSAVLGQVFRLPGKWAAWPRPGRKIQIPGRKIPKSGHPSDKALASFEHVAPPSPNAVKLMPISDTHVAEFSHQGPRIFAGMISHGESY